MIVFVVQPLSLTKPCGNINIKHMKNVLKNRYTLHPKKINHIYIYHRSSHSDSNLPYMCHLCPQRSSRFGMWYPCCNTVQFAHSCVRISDQHEKQVNFVHKYIYNIIRNGVLRNGFYHVSQVLKGFVCKESWLELKTPSRCKMIGHQFGIY